MTVSLLIAVSFNHNLNSYIGKTLHISDEVAREFRISEGKCALMTIDDERVKISYCGAIVVLSMGDVEIE